MKTIYTVNANRTMVGPGVWNVEAEAMVTGPDVKEEVYVYVSHYEGLSLYKVDDKSMIEECVDISATDDTEFDELMEKVERFRNGEDVTFGTAEPDDDEVMEMYEDLKDAKGSAYYPVFKVLDKLLDSMGNEIE